MSNGSDKHKHPHSLFSVFVGCLQVHVSTFEVTLRQIADMSTEMKISIDFQKYLCSVV